MFQLEKQREELKAEKEKIVMEKESLQEECLSHKAELQKRDLQMEEMKKEVSESAFSSILTLSQTALQISTNQRSFPSSLNQFRTGLVAYG